MKKKSRPNYCINSNRHNGYLRHRVTNVKLIRIRVQLLEETFGRNPIKQIARSRFYKSITLLLNHFYLYGANQFIKETLHLVTGPGIFAKWNALLDIEEHRMLKMREISEIFISWFIMYLTWNMRNRIYKIHRYTSISSSIYIMLYTNLLF